MALSRQVEAEERKVVSVLFCDLVGFTSASEFADPEDVRGRLVPYHRMLRREIGSFGGTVEKFIGDAVMAVFGIGGPGFGPEAAASAVRVGLSVQEALRGHLLAGRFAVKTRVGLATGDVIVDLVQTRDFGHGMVSGSVVSTAARLQAYAPHDTVVVCETTREVTDELIAYQEMPPVRVAGKPYPLDLWRALQPQDRAGANRQLCAVGAE